MNNLLNGIVRIGTVSSVDSNEKRVRCIFRDTEMTSGWLFVLQSPVTASVGRAGEDSHTHSVSLSAWIPKLNDVVVVLYLPVQNGDGFVLGRVG